MKVNNCTLEMWKWPYHRHSYGSHLFSQSCSNCGSLLLADVGHFEPRTKPCGHVKEILSAWATVFILEIFQDVWLDFFVSSVSSSLTAKTEVLKRWRTGFTEDMLTYSSPERASVKSARGLRALLSVSRTSTSWYPGTRCLTFRSLEKTLFQDPLNHHLSWSPSCRAFGFQLMLRELRSLLRFQLWLKATTILQSPVTRSIRESFMAFSRRKIKHKSVQHELLVWNIIFSSSSSSKNNNNYNHNHNNN